MPDSGFVLDGIITVIDCVNFRGYEDTSYTARMQAQYTDLILLNKWELVGGERELDLVLDHVYELNEDTPKLKCEGNVGVDPELVFGIDTKLFELRNKEKDEKAMQELVGGQDHHKSEVDIIQIISPNVQTSSDDASHDHCKNENCHHEHEHDHSNSNQMESVGEETPRKRPKIHTESSLTTFLNTLSKENIYRVKGIIRLQKDTSTNTSQNQDPHGPQSKQQAENNDDSDTSLYILNWAFSRFTLTPITKPEILERNRDVDIKLTVMGMELYSYVGVFERGFEMMNSNKGEVEYVRSGR
jgi:G3E family GTPase